MKEHDAQVFRSNVVEDETKVHGERASEREREKLSLDKSV